MASVNERLKELRLAADPPISGRAMADQLGVTSSAYHFYESRRGFKGRVLPVELTRRIAAVLVDRNIPVGDVLALAGFDEGERSADLLTKAQEDWLGLFDRLSPTQRKLIRQVAEQMITPDDDEGVPTAPPGNTVHTPASRFTSMELRR